MKFKFIENNRSSFPVKKMCHIRNVSQSGYYRWRKGPLSSLKIENEKLRTRINELFKEHNGMVGSPMITADLNEDPDSKHKKPVAPNVLDRQFTVSTPNTVWVTDIT